MATEHARQDVDVRGWASEFADAGSQAFRRVRGGGRQRLATGLGWFSIGLGLAEVAAPRLMARLIGVTDDVENRDLLRAAGLREIASGMGILMRQTPTGWVWARVGGDVMDLALLGSAFASDEAERGRLAFATAAVAGVTVLDLVSGNQLTGRLGGRRTISASKAITINRPAAEVYAFWRDFQNLPRFMRHVESVRASGSGRSHWSVKGPAGMSVEWDAEITEDRPGDVIAWRSLPGADVKNRGFVRFRNAPAGQGTELHVRIDYDPPGGALARAAASLFGEDPEQQLSDDLRRLKQVLETGEIARSGASESLLGMGQPGQPREAVQPYEEFARGER